MQVIWNDTVIADAPRAEVIYIEGNWYFPPDSIKPGYLQKSDTPCTCPWRGTCQYFNLGQKGESLDGAWTYPEPPPEALARVKKPFGNHVAFGRDAVVKQ